MLKQCPNCGSAGMEIITRLEEFEIKGEKVNANIKLYHCPDCGEEFSNPKELGDPYKLAYEKYREQKGMVKPEEIVAFRKKYQLTQIEMSNLLGFGEVTLTRYERGALQDSTHDNFLKLIMNPRNLLEMIRANPEVLDKEKKEKIVEQIKKELSFSIIESFLIFDANKNEFNGFSPFSIEKIAETIKILCFNRNIFKTKLMKLLFYSDFLNFKENRHSITGMRYAHLPYGPVPDQYELILGAIMNYDPAISLEPRDFDKYSGEVVVIKGAPHVSHLTQLEIKSISEVSEKLEFFTSKDVSCLSHLEPAYKGTQVGEMISYNFANNMVLWDC